MSANRHFDWEEILDRLEGRHAAEPEFSAHLETCDPCQTLRSEARALLGAMTLAATPEPSAILRARTWAQIASESARAKLGSIAAGAMAAAKEILATLVADSLQPSLAVRGVTSAAPRLLVYETPEYSVSLSLQDSSASGRHDIVGNLMPKLAAEIPNGAHMQVEDHPELGSVPISEFGEFRIEGLEVVPGTMLAIDLPEMRIHVGPLPAIG